jgi:hypothetical protein
MDTNATEDPDLEDLINFLAGSRKDVKQAALGIILGLTGSHEGIDRLKKKLDKLITFLLRLIPVQETDEASKKISEDTLSSLVNLSNDPEVMKRMLASKTIARVMDYIREGSTPHHKLLAMLLCNLTVDNEGCTHLLQLGQDKLEGLNMAILIKKFVNSGIMWEEGKDDPYEHIAAVLTNVTRLKQGRTLLLQPGRGLLQALVAQLKSPSEMRKRGAAGALKNICMTVEEDGTIEAVTSDPLMLEKMLEPINGQDPKEKDDSIRQAIAESLLSLASCKQGRVALWKLPTVKGPDLLRKGYELEECPPVCHAMELTADLFMSNQGELEETQKADDQGKQEALPAN